MSTQVANERPTHGEVLKGVAPVAAKGLKLVKVDGITPDGMCECGSGDQCDNPGEHPVGKEALK